MIWTPRRTSALCWTMETCRKADLLALLCATHGVTIMFADCGPCSSGDWELYMALCSVASANSEEACCEECTISSECSKKRHDMTRWHRDIYTAHLTGCGCCASNLAALMALTGPLCSWYHSVTVPWILHVTHHEAVSHADARMSPAKTSQSAFPEL